QFHDALPGSSIALVYEQLNAELEAISTRELAAAKRELSAPDRRPVTSDRRPGRGQAVLFNPLPQPRTLVIESPRRPAGTRGPVQRVGSGKMARWLGLAELGPLETAALPTRRAIEDTSIVRDATPKALDNGLVRAEFDARGRLRSLAVDGDVLELADAA